MDYPTRPVLVSLYADDITLYVRDPDTGLNGIIHEIIKFGAYAGITLNWGKSQISPLTNSSMESQVEYPLKWCDSELKYLGIIITKNREELLRANYGTVLNTVEETIRWIAMPLSMARCIALMKMVIMPKCLYLFINILYPPGRPFFLRLKSQLMCLAWGGETGQNKMEYTHIALRTTWI